MASAVSSRGIKKSSTRSLSDADHKIEPMYDESRRFWSTVTPNVDGMLGGFAEVSSADIAASRSFLLPFLYGKGNRRNAGCHRALDCGAGIGRITKHLLSELFDVVDMLEQTKAFLDVARTSYLGEKSDQVDRYICSGLQDFVPDENFYDVIWVQWVLSHVPDAGIERFLVASKLGLREGGLLVIKENVSGSRGEERDMHDVTITRPASAIREMVRKAGFIVVKEAKQNKFPVGLYEVRMFACRPSSSPSST